MLGLGIRTIIQMSEESAPTQNHQETELSKDEIPQNTPDAEQGNTLEAKNCVKFSEFKQSIETFSIDGHNPTCQKQTRQLTTLDDFLEKWCGLELDRAYKNGKFDKCSLSMPNVTNLSIFINKDKCEQLEQEFDKLCSS